MDVLAKLFGSNAKVKIMRLFLLNQEFVLKTDEVIKRAKTTPLTTVKELNGLAQLGLLHKGHQGKMVLWQLDRSFPFGTQLKNLLKNNLISHKRELAKKIGACGRLQALILSGVFIDDVEDGRVDILIVGNNLKRGAIDRLIKKFEAEIGRELNYAVLDSADFKYRLNACDKFLRDVLDYPHEIVVDKIGI